jgi:RNA polymerase sigma-70 factor (ECF subfamily)
VTRKQKSSNGLSERRLIVAARAGDPEARRELLERAAAPAWRWSNGFCRNRDDADDLAQDVLVALLRSLGTLRGDASLSTWTYTVARRACARRRTRERRAESLDAPGAARLRERADPGAGPARRLERRELADRLERAIAALPEPQRQVLVMRDVEGLGAAQVGEVLGIGERAVKSRLHRARVAVRASLAPYVSGGDAPGPSPGCPEAVELLSRRLEGELDRATCARMERHVRTCPACEARCASLRAVLGACRDYARTPVPGELRRAVRRAAAGSAG